MLCQRARVRASKGLNVMSAPRMKDVADLAGVSIKTVSRVLNNEPHVQDAVRDKVRAAVQELNYIPSRSARSLRGSKSYSISLVCHSGSNVYMNAIQFGAVVACQDRGYSLQVIMPPLLTGLPLNEIIDIFTRFSIPQKPDGVLLVSPFANDPTIDAALDSLGIPVARVGPVSINVSGVVVQINDHQATKEAVTHLIGLGHKRISFIRGRENQRATHERYSGYCAALRDANLPIEPGLISPGEFTFESGIAAAEHLLALETPPTAIFASNDDMAAGVIMAATKRGLNLPRDLSVVGFDDSEIAMRLLPNLTTVRQPLQELGGLAISSLIDAISDKNKTSHEPIFLPHELIIRDSTARLPSS